MRKLEKMHRELNEKFSAALASQMAGKFGVCVETRWDLFAGTLVTERSDGQDFTPEQHQYLHGFSEGYAAAMTAVFLADQESVK